jgi:hypothetical protein
LTLNAIFVFLSKTKKYEGLSVALPLTLLLGALSAVAACVTGWLLSENGGYDDTTLGYHKWLLLDIDDKHHMPPKGKTQPTPQDIILLR